MIFTGARIVSTVVVGGVYIAESGINVWNLLHKKGPLTPQEKLALLSEVVFSVLQAASITVSVTRAVVPDKYNNQLFKATELLFTTTTGASHVGKVAIPMILIKKIPNMNEKDWLEIIGVILYRLGETANVTSSTPQYNNQIHQFAVDVGSHAEVTRE